MLVGIFENDVIYCNATSLGVMTLLSNDGTDSL